MTLIPQGYGYGISHSRIYLISTTHSFLISYRFFFSTVFVLDSPAAAPHLWQGTLQADASLRIARRFSEKVSTEYVAPKQDVQSISVEVTPEMYLLDGVSVLVLITASVLVSGIVILKRNPKDILSEMS